MCYAVTQGAQARWPAYPQTQLIAHSNFIQTRRTRRTTGSNATRAIKLHTEAHAIVWLDEVRRGVTDDAGKLTLEKVTAGRHTLRVRANGFREKSLAITSSPRGALEVRLARTTDEAELSFQKAEEAREKSRDDDSRRAAAELYRRALELRPAFAAAHVGLARILLDLNDYKKALQEIADARSDRPVYPEASAVEGRIYRYAAFWDDAIVSFRRAIREGRGFQPEAHTGLALLLEEKGRNEEAVAEFRTAITQLSDSEPVIYQLLGSVYERMEKYKEAVEAYEKYLQLAPDGNLAPAVRSIIDQLRRQAAESEP
ncbi:MAG: protein O-mannosyl-transferase [Acidobacteriota bacterium]|jgi:tetratricopeptide (TPR) repeat protein|nr:protein O-mannosyl-transferase [Acidobacteriota bacterium]